MEILSANFIISNSDISKCPAPDRPEFAFIGRSNVGKSSLINMLTSRSDLAKTSSRPGKTQLINHFGINGNKWYLVDLPGYGFAKAPKNERKKWEFFIEKYILTRQNLYNLFVLIDCRHEPLPIDLEFITWLGESQVPFSIVFTKTDKLSKTACKKNIENYKNRLLEDWEELPLCFQTTSLKKEGKNEILSYIESIIKTN
ncbi:MAG: ribosome biogenesis GTP-binding protein YihA/YsxC [Bacteroidales bacterium]